MIAEKLDNLSTIILRLNIEDSWTLPTNFSGRMHMQRLRKVSESSNYLRRGYRQGRLS